MHLLGGGPRAPLLSPKLLQLGVEGCDLGLVLETQLGQLGLAATQLALDNQQPITCQLKEPHLVTQNQYSSSIELIYYNKDLRICRNYNLISNFRHYNVLIMSSPLWLSFFKVTKINISSFRL